MKKSLILTASVRFSVCAVALCSALGAGCLKTPKGVSDAKKTEGQDEAKNRKPFTSSYVPRSHEGFAVSGATFLLGNGQRIDGGTILIEGGRIQAVGKDLSLPEGMRVLNAAGKWLTPGLIDAHSHLGVYPSPSVGAHSDGNEATAPTTPQVWAQHSVWPQDPGFARALAGGITSLLILPGSANLIGGRGVTLKNVPSRSVQGMMHPKAPHVLKMACGENPKRVYGGKGRSPSTRMGNIAGYRQAYIGAKAYLEKLKKANFDPAAVSGRNLANETLALVLHGDILVHMHCYRADEMLQMLDLAKEFDFKITAFHHAVEAYKIRDVLAKEGVCAAVWADWGGFKMEAWDMIYENAPLVDAEKGGCAILHSDSPEGIQRLNQEVGKAAGHAKRIGMDLPPEELITWITENPAKSMGILEDTGTLEVGKAADLVLWNQNPFSVYAKAEKVFVDGFLYFDRNNLQRRPKTDFEVGSTHVMGTEAPR